MAVMGMYLIEFADKTTMSAVQCGEADNLLWIGVKAENLTFKDVVTIFEDKNRTARIKAETAIETGIYEGFTKLMLVQRTYEGNYLIALQYEEVE